MQEKHLCPYLKLGSTERCMKKCFGEYCGIHAGQIRRNKRTTFECTGCHKGVKASYALCKSCGGESLRKKIYWKKKQQTLQQVQD